MKQLRTMILGLVALFAFAACTAQSPAASEPAAITVPVDTMDAADTMESGKEMAEETAADAADDMMDGDNMAEESDAASQDDMASDEMAHDAITDDAMAEAEMSEDGTTMDESSAAAGALPGDRPAWQQIILTDATSGNPFTLADFAGKTIFVEPMATWCTNCRMQLINVQSARAQLNSDDYLFVGLSVETNLDQATLAQYTQDFGFDWTFAVATPELLQQLVAEFGRAIINPPSTPHFIIRPDGTFGELVTGIDPAEQIIAHLQG